jgi:hypothetical protein
MQLLNSNITTEEVLKAAKSLKNGKAGGRDDILNEMLKISCAILLNFIQQQI